MKHSVWLLLLLLTHPLAAQNFGRHVEVLGQAEVVRAPDQAVVTLGVESWNADLALARQDNLSKVNRLLTVPTRFGVPVQDVKTDFASVQPDYEHDERGRVRSISGYRVTQVISIVVKDLRVVEPLVTAAFGAGVNRLDGVVFGLTNPSQAAAEARLLAVRDAKAKSEALARELGAKVGKVLVISDLGGGNAGPELRFKSLVAEAPAADAYAPGQIIVGATVNVWFELRD